MNEEIKDIMDALENNELKNDGFWGRACSRLSQQLQTAKEENEKLMEQLNTKYLEWEETFMENQNLAQQNKQMREALDKIGNYQINTCNCNYQSTYCPDYSLCIVMDIANKALGE